MTAFADFNIKQVPYDSTPQALELALKSNTNKFEALKDIGRVLDDASQAFDSESIVGARDIITQALEEGLSGDQAIKRARDAGIASRILGSEAVQESLRKSRASIIAQRAEDRLAETYNTNKLANQFIAEMEDYKARIGAGGAYAIGSWFDQNRDKIKANPNVFKQVLDHAIKSGYDLTTFADPVNGTGIVAPSWGDLQSQYNRVDTAMHKMNKYGFKDNLSPEETLARTNFDKWVEHQGKLFGHEGSSFADFRDNMYQGYKALKGAFPELDDEVILYAMSQNIDTEFFSGYGDEEDIEIDNAKQWLTANARDFDKSRNNYRQLADIKSSLGKAIKDDAYRTAVSSAESVRQQINDAVQKGVLTQKQGDEALARLVTKINSANAAYTRSFKDANSLLKIIGTV